jgi:hypothetical protein
LASKKKTGAARGKKKTARRATTGGVSVQLPAEEIRSLRLVPDKHFGASGCFKEGATVKVTLQPARASKRKR